eukprot:m.6185 g.6185  ORF g.6185 m.6185 type:complete len:951 (+) comp2555_c0_seq1:80-2932(+)
MPLRLEISQILHNRSDRVKCVDLHPSEPWMLVALYSGTVNVWNYETKTLIKTFEVCDVPVRSARFVERKNWIITGSDDMQIRVYNYNTLEKVHTFEAHTDYIRCLAVHPNQPYLLSCSDDMSIRMWDWSNNWTCRQVFEGHAHYVMSVVFNPKDVNTFASCSLDKTIKVWQLGSSTPNFTLEGHTKGVNCIAYFQGGEKPYLASGADDRQVRIWDYQSKNCVQILEGHSENISAVCFHPELPLILTGSEDGSVRVWHSSTYNLENTLSYRMERVWTMGFIPGSNNIALGYDEGSVMIKVGREEPAMSMDSNGKVLMAKHNDVHQAIVTKTEIEEDGEALNLALKDMGACEIYPQTLKHSPNGRFAVVCGDGEYIVHTALSFRNKSFGQALEFVWSEDSSQYATRENSSNVKVFKQFKEKYTIQPDFRAERIYGGHLIGIKGPESLSFYQWSDTEPILIRTIEINCDEVFWSDNGERVLVSTEEEGCFVLKYNSQAVAEALAGDEPIDEEEGIEEAFEAVNELDDTVKTGAWVGSCFLYTNNGNRLNYYVGGEIVTVAHLDRPYYLLGYLPSTGYVYLGDKDLTVVAYKLPLSVLEYQTAVMEGDLESADVLMSKIPLDQRNRVAHFLEKQGYKEQALVVSNDPEHKFELALALHKLTVAKEVAKEIGSRHKWKLLADVAMKKSLFDLAEECLAEAKDFSGQLLLYSSSGKSEKMNALAKEAGEEGHQNIAFTALFLQGKVDECLELLVSSGRIAEAALFARTYKPSAVNEMTQKWKESLAEEYPKIAQSLATPEEYPNLFPEFSESLLLEEQDRASEINEHPARDTVSILLDRSKPRSERSGAPLSSTAAISSNDVDEEEEEEEIDDVGKSVEEETEANEEKAEEVEEEEEVNVEEDELQEHAAPEENRKEDAGGDNDDDDDFDLDDDDLDLDLDGVDEIDDDEEDLLSD